MRQTITAGTRVSWKESAHHLRRSFCVAELFYKPGGKAGYFWSALFFFRWDAFPNLCTQIYLSFAYGERISSAIPEAIRQTTLSGMRWHRQMSYVVLTACEWTKRTALEPPDHPVVACIRRSWFTDTNGSHYFGNICCFKEQHEQKAASSHVGDFLLNTHAHWLQCQNSDFWLTFVNQNRLCLILLPGSHRMDPEHRLFKDLFDGYNFNARPVVNKSDAVVVRFDMAFSQLITLVRANSNRHQYGTRTLISGSVLTLDSTAVSPEI